MVSISGAGKGALSGAGTGATIGSIIPGLGTGLGAAIGGGIGGLAGLFGKSGNGLFTRKGKEQRFERFTPEQQQLTELLRNILSGQGEQPQGGLLGSLFGEGGFDAFAAPAMRQYQEEIVPGLAERFSALGAQKSSGFQQALARSGENLATRLGEARGQQQQGLLGALLGQVMQPQFNTQYTPGGPTGLSQGLSGIAGGIGQGLGQGLGGLGQGNLSDLLSRLLGGGQ